TFTRADSLDAAWTSAAEGDDKVERAHALATCLADALPGAGVARIVGRTFPEESHSRFAFGVRWRDASSGKGPRASPDAAPDHPPTELGGDHYLSVTPDPGVVEVNMAPCANASAFWRQATKVWGAAAAAGLSPVRHRFNGDVVDSGGGGQLTLGGAKPDTSPFVRYPHVLPALVRYLNN